ncbi:MAG: hypothetical protein IJB97_08550 [Clostridia bacterium]|nr:hypothetical protein [Clostridia bacterium]
MDVRKKLPYTKNNVEFVKGKYPKQWRSYKAFSERYPDACLQMDGIVNPDIWQGEKLKILSFLKDSYRINTNDYISTFVLDLCNLCNEELFKYNKTAIATWWNLLKWVNAIRVSLGENKVDTLQTIAHMNISKLACDGKESVYTRQGVLETAMQKDGELLYKQYKEINPNIVICGNTEYYFFKMLEEHSEQKPIIEEVFKGKIEGKKPLYCYLVNNSTIVFSAYHPCILNTKPEHFEIVIEKNKEKIHEILYKR